MRYVEARIDEYNRDEAYRFYISKSLQLIPQSKWLTKDYSDLVNPKPEDKREGGEIIADIMARAGLHFEG